MKKLKQTSLPLGQSSERSLTYTPKSSALEFSVDTYPVKFKCNRRGLFSEGGLTGLEIKYFGLFDFDDIDKEYNDQTVMVFHDNSYMLFNGNPMTALRDIMSGSRLAELGFVSIRQGLKIDQWHNYKKLELLKRRHAHLGENIKTYEEKLSKAVYD
jgi:hypothetical protein